MPAHDVALIQEARRVARLQARRLKLRRELREVDGELRTARRNLRKLAASVAGDPFDQAPPVRGLDS